MRPADTLACIRAMGVWVDPGPRWLADIAGDDPQESAAVTGGQQDHVVGLESLIGRRDHLVLGREVHPQLDTVEQAT